MYKKTPDGHVIKHKPTQYLLDYLEAQGVLLPEGLIQEEDTQTGESIIDVDTVEGGMKIEEFTHGVGAKTETDTVNAVQTPQQSVQQQVTTQNTNTSVQPTNQVVQPVVQQSNVNQNVNNSQQ